MSTAVPSQSVDRWPGNAKIAIVAARFNQHIVDPMLEGCLSRLNELGAERGMVRTFRVPGAFELTATASKLAKTESYEAIICLGCVIRGDTPHFDYVCMGATQGLTQVAQQYAMPIIFGVLTTENEQQARDRIGGSHGHAGVNAANTAAEMIALFRQIGR